MADNLEALAEVMHVAWCKVMADSGRHSPDQCSAGGCGSCHAGIRPWSALTEQVKQINREGVRGILRFHGERLARGVRSMGRKPRYIKARAEPGRVYPVVLEISALGREWPNIERECLLTTKEAKQLIREIERALAADEARKDKGEDADTT